MTVTLSEAQSVAIYRVLRAEADYKIATGKTVIIRMYIPRNLYETIVDGNQGDGDLFIAGVPVSPTRGDNIFFDGTHGEKV